MIRVSRFALCLLAFQACSSQNTTSHPSGDSGTEAPFPVSASDDLEQTLDAVVGAGVAPGVSLTVERPGYQAWSGAAGVASIETGAALTPAERFRAGSMLKTAIATAVLQLVEHGELSLSDDLTALLPSAVATRIPAAEAISLRMLLNHTSGIPEFSDSAFDAAVASDPLHVWTLDELLDRALAHPSPSAPGAGWSYSNTNYILLGEILRESTGKSWRTVVRERVFSRAKLAHTTLPEEGNPLCDGCARGYEPVANELVDVTEMDPSMAGAAGGAALITTPADLATFIRALASGNLFDDPATLELMLDFADAPVPAEAQTGYGLGLVRFEVGEIELVGHLGGTAGFQGFVFFEPGTGTVAAGYMNQRGDFGAYIMPVLDAIGRIQGQP